MLYHLSSGGSTKLFSQNLFTLIWPRICHELFTNYNNWLKSKGPGLDTQRSRSVPFFKENSFKYILKIPSGLKWRYNSESQVDRVGIVEFGYHGEWYTLLIIDIIDWNDLEKFVSRTVSGYFLSFLYFYNTFFDKLYNFLKLSDPLCLTLPYNFDKTFYKALLRTYKNL